MTVTTHTDVAARRAVFLPGYVGGVENVVPTLEALVDTPEDWCVEIGACDEEAFEAIPRLAARLGVRHRVMLLGYVGDEDLDDAFERAAIVVRWKAAGWPSSGEPQHGAVSGPLMEAMAHGCAIITNDTRGIVQCLSATGAIRVGAGADGREELRAAVTALVADPTRRLRMSALGRSHAMRDHGAAAVAHSLTEV
jgi:glycosyltransferase involved in cell wall biosynthesis